MKLELHIANRFLNDPNFLMELVETMHGTDVAAYEGEKLAQAAHLLKFIEPKGAKHYWITNTVLELLPMFDNKKAMSVDGWAPFANLPDFKDTYVLPDNRVIRVMKEAGFIHVYDLSFKFKPGDNLNGTAYSIVYWVDISTGRLCEHFQHPDTEVSAPAIYSLLCFLKLTDNEEISVPAGHRWGTKKQGKLVNITKFPLIVVNSRWNTRINMTDAFWVSGHFRLQPYGTGRASYKLIYIEPYKKQGYTREPAKTLHSAK